MHGGTVTLPHRQWHHPSYNATTIDNDIAVITLANPVRTTPIRMTTSGDTASYAAGTSAKVYGWGRTSSTSQDSSDTLKTATLPVQSDSTCAGYYGGEFVKGHMVCAGRPASGSGTTSACNGDSGGPLVVNGRIVGVVSWEVENCVANGAHSVFAKVSTYVGAAYPRVDDTNVSGDHKADLWVRNASTKTGCSKDSNGSSFAARASWGSWSGADLVLHARDPRQGRLRLEPVQLPARPRRHHRRRQGGLPGPYARRHALPVQGHRKATSEIFATRISVGTDFKQYDIFG